MMSTNMWCVTFQKSKGLNYTTTKASNLAGKDKFILEMLTFRHNSQYLTITVDYCLLAALEKQWISGKVYDFAYNKSGSKVNVNQSCHLFV